MYFSFYKTNNIDSNNKYGIRNVGRRITKQTVTLIEEETQNTGKWKAYSIDLSNYFTADPRCYLSCRIKFQKRLLFIRL